MRHLQGGDSETHGRPLVSAMNVGGFHGGPNPLGSAGAPVDLRENVPVGGVVSDLELLSNAAEAHRTRERFSSSVSQGDIPNVSAAKRIRLTAAQERLAPVPQATVYPPVSYSALLIIFKN